MQPENFGIGRLFWSIREAVIVADATTERILLWNPAAEALFGYSASEAIDLRLDVLVPERLRTRHRAGLARFRATGHGSVIDSRVPLDLPALRKTGEETAVELTLSPVDEATVEGRFVLALLRDVSERKRIEEAQRFLAEVSDVFAPALDYDATLRNVARVAVPFLADACTVDVIADQPLHPVAVAHVDPAKEALLREAQHRHRLYSGGAHPVVQVARTGLPLLIQEVPAAWPEATAADLDYLGPVRALGLKSFMAVPLQARECTFGVISFAAIEPGRRYGPSDLALAEELARRAALVIENARLYRELGERERRLHELVGRLLLAQEEERHRIAYDVHDGLAQVAAAAQQHLEALAAHYRPRSPRARQTLDHARELAQRTVGEARRITADLRPTALDDFGLATALRLEADTLRAEGWEVTFDGEPESERLPPTIEASLFRVAQEALSNVRKHARTARAHLALHRRGGTVRLEIRDWGRGFQPSVVLAGVGSSGRVGLAGMRERVAWLGGRCTVRSRPGGGTRILVEVPLPEPDAGDVARGE